MEESDNACEVERADYTETKKLNPFVVIEDRYGQHKKHEVVRLSVLDGNKKLEKKPKKKGVNPDHQIFLIHYGGPRLLSSEIENLHPYIISVKSFRQKGKHIVTFRNEMERNKAFEDLQKTEVEGKLKLYKCRPDYVKLPFQLRRPDFSHTQEKTKKRIS